MLHIPSIERPTSPRTSTSLDAAGELGIGLPYTFPTTRSRNSIAYDAPLPPLLLLSSSCTVPPRSANKNILYSGLFGYTPKVRASPPTRHPDNLKRPIIGRPVTALSGPFGADRLRPPSRDRGGRSKRKGLPLRGSCATPLPPKGGIHPRRRYPPRIRSNERKSASCFFYNINRKNLVQQYGCFI